MEVSCMSLHLFISCVMNRYILSVRFLDDKEMKFSMLALSIGSVSRLFSNHFPDFELIFVIMDYTYKTSSSDKNLIKNEQSL